MDKTLTRVSFEEYPNGLPGKNALIGISKGTVLTANKSKTKIYSIEYKKVKEEVPEVTNKFQPIIVEDGYYAKTANGGWTVRLIAEGNAYCYSIGNNHWCKI